MGQKIESSDNTLDGTANRIINNKQDGTANRIIQKYTRWANRII